jgi:hypothetical protein
MRKLLAAIIPALLLLSGCLPVSVAPLYAKDETTFDPRLVGTWFAHETGDEWRIAARADNLHYDVQLIQGDGESALFEGRLTTLGAATLLDLLPAEQASDAMDPIPGHDLDFLLRLPLHTWAMVDFGPSSLKLDFPDPAWLDATLRDRPETIAHVRSHTNTPLLTVTTPQLREFVSAHLADNTLYELESGIEYELKRVSRKAYVKGGHGWTSHENVVRVPNNSYDSQYRQTTPME